MSDAAQYQYGTQPPPQDLPRTGSDVVVPLSAGVLLIFLGVCIASAIKERIG
jgi:hypothetical protein